LPRPTPAQHEALLRLREHVVSHMNDLGMLGPGNQELLFNTPLGVLRKNATQRHGVTRWKRHQEGLELLTVDLHPRLLTEEWTDYGTFVMFHEFIHALGWRAHDAEFRSLEARWPNKQAVSQGPLFTNTLRLEQAKWIWYCPSCEGKFPRKRRANGRFQCRGCKVNLLDMPRSSSR